MIPAGIPSRLKLVFQPEIPYNGLSKEHSVFTSTLFSDDSVEISMPGTTYNIILENRRRECSGEMRQLLAALRGNTNTEEGGIAREIADAVKEIREHSQWRTEYMLYELNMRDRERKGHAEGLEEGLQQGRKEGRSEMAKEIAKALISEGMSNEMIAGCCALSLQEVQDLRNTFHE